MRVKPVLDADKLGEADVALHDGFVEKPAVHTVSAPPRAFWRSITNGARRQAGLMPSG